MEINATVGRQTKNTRSNIQLSDIKLSSKCSEFLLLYDLCCDGCKSITESESGQLKNIPQSDSVNTLSVASVVKLGLQLIAKLVK